MENTTTRQIAKHLSELYFGGTWTWCDLQMTLKDVSWQEATRKMEGYNSIAMLVYHIHYFVKVAAEYLESGNLEGSDKLSFHHPPLHNESEWQGFLEEVWGTGRRLATLIEKLPDSTLGETFGDKKYGIYFRNLFGTIEHSYYHMGQIVILKKMVKGV